MLYTENQYYFISNYAPPFLFTLCLVILRTCGTCDGLLLSCHGCHPVLKIDYVGEP